MSVNQWKVINSLKESFSKLTTKYDQHANKNQAQMIKKFSSTLHDLWKYLEQHDRIQYFNIRGKGGIGGIHQIILTPQWKSSNPMSKCSIFSQTQHVISSLQSAENEESTLKRIEAFISHIKQYPEGRNSAIRAGAFQILFKIQNKTKNNNDIQESIREALALLGYSKPVKGNGIRILSMDGGGIRGLLMLEMLKKLEELTGKKVYELFDLICGVSTGAILSFSLAIDQKSVEEVAEAYKNISMEVFKQSALWGTGNLMWSQAYYNTALWEKKLRDHLGTKILISTARDPNCPKLCAVSAVVNQSRLSAYVFRNYSLPWKVKSQYFGSNLHEVWQAARASAAAPTYFEEFKLGNFLHQDGGILNNNPTAVALHEAKLIWPNTPVQCVISFGTGRTVPSPTEVSVSKDTPEISNSTSWANKFYKILDSATDTEGVHIMLNDLMPDHVYYRFNPYLTEMISMVEIDQKRIEQLERDAIMYLRRNEDKFQEAARVLNKEKSFLMKAKEFINLRRDLYGF